MANERPNPAYLWLNGEMIRWEDAMVHASLLGWSTMAAVFEGIKAYWNPEEGQLYAYQFREHYQRFARSMKMQRMNSPWSPDQLIEASLALVRANGAREDTYISPLAYFGDSTFYGTQTDSSTHIRIVARPFQSGLGSGKTITACVSSWTRISENTLSPRIKAIANYQNSRTAAIEAKQNGYDQPILLNAQGKVTEGAAACLFFIRDGVVITPWKTSGILESVTRETILKLCHEALDLPVEEREVDRTELYVADEVFFCGTGAEIRAVSNVDGYTIGDGGLGPITTRIEALFHAIVRGRDATYRAWSTPIYAAVGTSR